MSNPSSHRAFSLLELLVVIAIITILAALILPSISHSKEKAKESLCTSNLKQIHDGFLMYAHDHNGHGPAPYSSRNRLWSYGDLFGGNDGSDTHLPPAKARPLFPYVSPGEVFHCPADAGIQASNRGGTLLQPTLYKVQGNSYTYNSDGLKEKSLDSIKSPANLILLFEPPAFGGDPQEPRSITVYWHRARKPGSASGEVDTIRGPRVSPFAFIDGHIKFIDCTGQYFGFPRNANLEDRE